MGQHTFSRLFQLHRNLQEQTVFGEEDPVEVDCNGNETAVVRVGGQVGLVAADVVRF